MQAKFILNLFFALVAPVFLLYEAYKSKSFAYQRWVLTLFITLYGSTIFLLESNDGFRHRAKVYEHYMDLSFSEFSNELVNILTFRVNASRAQDVYKHVLSYSLAAIGLPGLFFTVVAFVYGYFFSGAMLLIFRNFNWKNSSLLLLGFAFILLLVRNIEGVNTVRTWTGLWVLVYACLRYYETKKLKYVLLMFLPPFIHVGYFIMAIPAYLVLVLGNRPLIYSGLFILSSFFSFFNPPETRETIEESTELGQSKVRGYYVEERAGTNVVLEAQTDRGATWYRAFQKAGVQRWAISVLIYTLIFSGIYLSRMDFLPKTLFSIGLLTLTLSNSTWFLSAVANRSGTIGMVFILAGFIMAWMVPGRKRLFDRNPFILKSLLWFSLLLFVPNFIYSLSTLIDFPSVFLMMGPFIVWIDPDANMSLKEFIKLFFL